MNSSLPRNQLFCKKSVVKRLTNQSVRSRHPDVFIVKGGPKIYNKFTGKHPHLSAISIKLESNLTEITFRVNLLHISGTPFPKNTSGRLLLECCIRPNLKGSKCLVEMEYVLSPKIKDKLPKNQTENFLD